MSDLASEYGWIITRDVLCDFYGEHDDSDAGRTGPAGLSADRERQLQRQCRLAGLDPGKRSDGWTACLHIQFRMYDDDNELYYEGILWDSTNGCHDMAPLHDFGMPNAGCTRIDIFRKGAWIRV